MKKKIIFLIMIFFISILCSVKVNAQSIVVGYGDYYNLKVKLGGENWTGDNWFTINQNTTRSILVELEFFNNQTSLENNGDNNPIETPSYVLATLCVANGYVGSWSIGTHDINGANTTGWFDETTFIGYSAGNDNDDVVYCTTPDGRLGRRAMIEWKVVWAISTPTYSGDKANFVSEGILNMKNTLSYKVYAHFYTFMVSDQPMLMEIRQNRQLQDLLYNQLDTLNSIDGNVQDLESLLSSLQSQLHSDNQAIEDAVDDITNADYNGSTEQPNTSDYDDYEDAENDLLDTMSNMNLNSVDIAIDTNSASWIWNTLTSILQSNALIFSMVISILSVGIIKLMLSR